MRKIVRRWHRDERGFVLVFLAVALPALLGLVGLAIEGVRLMTLDTELAGIADSAALAAANQLDRSPDAIPNARDAANALANDAASADGAGRTSLSFRFGATLSDLRDSPTFTLADVEGAGAAYVEVTTGVRSIAASFLELVGATVMPVRRRAVAHSEYYACDVTPLAVCQADPDAFVASSRPGRQYLFRLGPAYANGSLALLDPSDDRGGRRSVRLLASNAPAFCYTRGIAPRRNVTPSEFDDALNTRFDRYYNRQGPIAPDLAVYPPAPNIIQGRRLETCTSPPEGGSLKPPYPMPRDSAYLALGRSSQWDAGTGDWRTAGAFGGSGAPAAVTAVDEYLFWNHANKSPLFQQQLRASATRYELYLRELGLDDATETNPVATRGGLAAADTMPTGGPLLANYNGLRESPVPRCYAGPGQPVEARRRVVYMTVTDCGALDDAGAAGLSRRVGKFFLTEPSDGGAVLAELVQMLTPRRDDGKYRHVVQLVDTF